MLIITLKGGNFIYVQRELYNKKHGFYHKIQLEYFFGISIRL
jgi:hypothetical protein